MNKKPLSLNKYDIIVVGAGLSGVVIAEQFSSKLNKKILIVDKREHIAGNCYDYIDSQTNILMIKYLVKILLLVSLSLEI